LNQQIHGGHHGVVAELIAPVELGYLHSLVSILEHVGEFSFSGIRIKEFDHVIPKLRRSYN
jgi:hypothetical protein